MQLPNEHPKQKHIAIKDSNSLATRHNLIIANATSNQYKSENYLTEFPILAQEKSKMSTEITK